MPVHSPVLTGSGPHGSSLGSGPSDRNSSRRSPAQTSVAVTDRRGNVSRSSSSEKHRGRSTSPSTSSRQSVGSIRGIGAWLRVKKLVYRGHEPVGSKRPDGRVEAFGITDEATSVRGHY